MYLKDQARVLDFHLASICFNHFRAANPLHPIPRAQPGPPCLKTKGLAKPRFSTHQASLPWAATSGLVAGGGFLKNRSTPIAG